MPIKPDKLYSIIKIGMMTMIGIQQCFSRVISIVRCKEILLIAFSFFMFTIVYLEFFARYFYAQS